MSSSSPLSDDDGDPAKPGRRPDSDLSPGSSSDDGIGEECGQAQRSSRPHGSGARSRGRGRARADAGRDLSMDSGIQGSSCDLDVAVDSSSASDPHEDDHLIEVLGSPQSVSRPSPIGGCELPRPPRTLSGEVPEAAEVIAEREAFKAVDELYVAAGAVLPGVGDGVTQDGRVSSARTGERRTFTETHFDSAPSLLSAARTAGAAVGLVFSSAPVGLDAVDALDGACTRTATRTTAHPTASACDLPTSARSASYSVGAVVSVPSNSSIVSLPNVTSASVQQGGGLPAPLSPPEAFRRSHFRDSSRQSRRFNSADDVFRASLLRHSLPAKPPRTPSVRASLDDDLSRTTTPASPADHLHQQVAVDAFPSAINIQKSLSSGPSHHAVVAIDFGTTYSGYAFCYTRDSDCQIHMMRKWEGGDPGLHNEKAPTTLLLTPEGKFHSFGFLARDTFHDLHPDQAKQWLYFDKFKMALLSQTTLTRDTTLTAANGRAVAALTVLGLSLGHLRERALAELVAADQGHPGDSLGVDWAAPGAVRWVLTVPALWGPPATQLLREAAHTAGLASPALPEALLIVLEPEAASLCCRQLRLHQLLQMHQMHQLHQLHDQTVAMASLVLEPGAQGTQYMVVDCGGGTVDITVHELSGQRATLRELHKASGGACGSLGVDREFERLLSSVFGADFMSHFRRKRPAAYVELLLSFEARKRSADPDRDAALTIFPPFAFVEAYRKFRGKEVDHAVRKFGRPGEISWSSQGMLRLSPQLMADLFRPTLDHICGQVEEVLRSPRLRGHIQYLFLVGGFAQSLMLQHRVRAQLGGRLKVVVPQGVGLTTLRGAVLYGLDPVLVVSRRSKHTIGVGVLKRFQAAEHPQDKLVTLSDGSKWCCDVLDVLVVADQPLGPGEAVTRSYTPASAKQTNIIIHIYCSSDTSPPKFVTDPGVIRCGTLRLALPNSDPGEDAVDLASSSDSRGDTGTAASTSAPGATREIVARIEFGGTELAASAQDLSSGRCVRTQLDFLSTAV